MDHGAGVVVVRRNGDFFQVHQLAVARQHLTAVYRRPNAVTGDFLHSGNPRLVGRTTPGGYDGLGDRVGGKLLRQGGQLQQLPLLHPLRVYRRDGKFSLGQGARLVKNHDSRLGQGLQVVAALHQNALFGGAPQSAEEGKGDGDDQGAGTGYHQEVQRPGYPGAPLPGNQGGDDRQGQGREDHNGGVVPGEFGDEVLRLGLFLAGVLHQVQDAGDGGLPERLAHLHMEQPGQIDAAGDYLVPRHHVTGQGLAGEGGGVQGGGPLQDGPVQGHPLPRLDDDHVPHRYLLRVHLDQLALPLYVGVVGADVHQVGDGLPGPGDGHVLEQLSHLVEEHHRHCLGVLANQQRPDGGHRHEKVFVEDLAVEDVADGFPEHVPADHQIRNQKQRPPGQGVSPAAVPVLDHTKQGNGAGQPDSWQKDGGNEQEERDQDTTEHLFLFPCHAKHLSIWTFPAQQFPRGHGLVLPPPTPEPGSGSPAASGRSSR